VIKTVSDRSTPRPREAIPQPWRPISQDHKTGNDHDAEGSSIHPAEQAPAKTHVQAAGQGKAEVRQRGGQPAQILHSSGSLLPPPKSVPLPTRPVSSWGMRSRQSCWSGCKTQAEGAQPSSQPMGDLDFPRLHLDIYLL